jgi:predicted nucleic acid-binding protein
VIVYLDTSVVLRVLLAQPDLFSEWGRWTDAYASELLGVEARRAIDRLRVEGALDDAGVASAQEGLRRVERTLALVPLARPVLARASLPMPTALGTLDAMHIATALLLRERRALDPVFVTHDAQQALAARALGFECAGSAPRT